MWKKILRNLKRHLFVERIIDQGVDVIRLRIEHTITIVVEEYLIPIRRSRGLIVIGGVVGIDDHFIEVFTIIVVVVLLMMVAVILVGEQLVPLMVDERFLDHCFTHHRRSVVTRGGVHGQCSIDRSARVLLVFDHLGLAWWRIGHITR